MVDDDEINFSKHSLLFSRSLPLSFSSPGAPLGKDETAATRENLGWKYGAFEVRLFFLLFFPFFFGVPREKASTEGEETHSSFPFLFLSPILASFPFPSSSLRSPSPRTTSLARPPPAARPPRPSGRRRSPTTPRSTRPRAPSSSRCCRASFPPAGRSRSRHSRRRTRAWRRACTRRRC